MRAGKLRHRLVIKLDAETRDATSGDVVYTSGTVGTVWAGVEPYAGNERLAAGRVYADTTHRVTLRYFAGLTKRHWFDFKGRRLEIMSVMCKDERDIELVCECKEVE